MNNYTTVAKRKIKHLKGREDFKKVVSETKELTELEFTGSICKITSYAKVTWESPNENSNQDNKQ